MAEVKLSYLLLPDYTNFTNGSLVDLNVTYDANVMNPDGSFTITGASGTYAPYIPFRGLDAGRYTIAGVLAGGSLHGNDNEIFIGSQPYVTGNGIAFTLDGAGAVDFYSAPTSAGIEYHEVTSFYPTTNNTAATLVTESPVCYCGGTLLRTVSGDVPVEELAIGDLLATLSGVHRPIKWIGRRRYLGRFANKNPHLLPICFKAGSLADSVPVRDLWVSPNHAMFIDGVLVPAELLVNGVSVLKIERVDTIAYYHVELDTHDVLLAEGAPSESYVDDNNRGFFQNCHHYYTLYSGAEEPEPVYCAPRLEEGYALEAIRRHVRERAGIKQPWSCGALRGAIEGIAEEVVYGWAQDERYPDAPICLDLMLDGILVRQVLANAYRSDLAAAGVGDGCHAFEVRLPPGSAGAAAEMRRSLDGAPLAYATRRDRQAPVPRLAA
jgi:hypothetical protein